MKIINLNYNDLNEESKNRLLMLSKKDLETLQGKQLEKFAKDHNLTYETFLEEEAMRNLNNYNFKFHI